MIGQVVVNPTTIQSRRPLIHNLRIWLASKAIINKLLAIMQSKRKEKKVSAQFKKKFTWKQFNIN